MGKAKDLATGEDRFANVAGDTFTGTVIHNGNVGIGTSPSVPLQVAKAGGANWMAQFQNTTAATPYGVNIYDASSASNGYPLLQVTDSAGSGVYFRVDSGTGTVTKPNQPSFYAYTSTDYTAEGELTGGGNWAERWDTGNNFSAGIFTAPVAGKYFFSVMWDANAIRATIDIQVNNVSMLRYEPTGRTDDTWETHAYSGSLNLAANDAVRLYGRLHSQTSNNPYHMGGGLWGHFSGFLIG